MRTGWYYVSSRSITCAVYVVDGYIKWTPPVLKKFTGQEIGRLAAWMSRQGGFVMTRMANERADRRRG